MNNRQLARVTVLAVMVIVPVAAGAGQDAVAPTRVGGCPAENLAFHRCALEKAKTFVPPRTPGGRPDLQGYWRSVLTQAFSVEGVPEDEPMIKDPVMPWVAAPPEVVEPAQIVGMHARRHALGAIRRLIVVGMAKRAAQAFELQAAQGVERDSGFREHALPESKATIGVA